MRALSVLVFLGTLLVSSVASAQTNDVERLIYNLANSEDFRVRTQAALALGASKTERAVTPLCSALADVNTTVRAASAAALGRLGLRAGQACLEKRLEAEPSDVVKATIQKALEVIKNGGAGGAEPLFATDTKYYIAIGKTSDKTGRKSDEVDGIVRAAMMSKVGQTAGFLAAPPGETAEQAKKRLQAHAGVKGYFLSPVITAEYIEDTLKVKIDVAMATYPDKDVFGQFSFFLKEGGVSPGSTAEENDLIRTVAERAVEKFAGVAASR
jgi:hypothetical protein